MNNLFQTRHRTVSAFGSDRNLEERYDFSGVKCKRISHKFLNEKQQYCTSIRCSHFTQNCSYANTQIKLDQKKKGDKVNLTFFIYWKIKNIFWLFMFSFMYLTSREIYEK